MENFYKRWQEDSIYRALKSRRVVLLAGARQCGKTTLAKQLAIESVIYRTLDDLTLRQLALSDPMGFVKPSGNMQIIDEIQRAPDLLSAIKLVVDENNQAGQYFLTGSANIQSLPGVQESLAGRISKVRLRPLTQGELLGSQPTFIENAFQQHFPILKNHSYDRSMLLHLALRGGFPEAIQLDKKERQHWYKDYIAALLERDLQDITRIHRLTAMQQLVSILAAWSSKFMDISAIGAGLSIRRPTLESYINALKALYLIETVQPWTHTDYDRVGKQTKLYMTDSGLMAAILRMHHEKVELDADRSGKLIETFLFNELAAEIDAKNGMYELFHYRDREQREIDFLIEREDQALLGIEIKAGSTISTADFKHLRWFKDHLAKTRPFVGIVLYSGNHIGSMGDHLWAVPFGVLWD